MNIRKLSKSHNGWKGQALAEYMPTLSIPIVVGILLLSALGGIVFARYQQVNECFFSATEGELREGCRDHNAEPGPNEPSTTSSSSTGSSSTGSSSTGSSSTGSSSTGSSSTGSSSTGSSSTGSSSTGSNSTGSSSTGSSSGGSSSGSSSGGATSGSSTGDNVDITSPTEEPDDGGEPDPEAACPADADFSGLAAGTILNTQFDGMTITTNDPTNHPAMIFDTSNPTGGDDDLGTPHSDFGGPGHGEGGAAGQLGENSAALGNVVIISEDGDTNDPDDNGSGGQIIFTFDQGVNVTYMYFLDQDNGGVAATVTLFDQSDGQLASQQVVVPSGGNRAGDNGVYRVDLDTTGVYKMVATLPGSGAIASVFFCEEPITEEPEDNTYQPECGEVKSVIVEPRENNAQHIMVQYPVECDNDGNILENQPGAGVSNLVVVGNSDAYLSATLSGHLSGTFDAWCVDYENPIYTNQSYVGDNYANTGQSVDRPQNLPLINWLINYDWQANGYEIMDMQGAIWLLIDSTPIDRSDLGPRAEQLAQLAIAQAGDDNTDPTIQINEQSTPTTVYVYDMEGSGYWDGSKWRGQVLVTVRNDLDEAVSGVTVRVDFSRGGSNKTCTTNSNGQCTVTTNRIGSRHASTVATFDTISNTDLSYNAGQNRETTVTIDQP